MTQTLIITVLVILAAVLLVIMTELQDYSAEDELDTPKSIEDKDHESTQHRSPG